MKSDTSFHGHHDILPGTGVKGKIWFLNKKVLLKKSTT